MPVPLNASCDDLVPLRLGQRRGEKSRAQFLLKGVGRSDMRRGLREDGTSGDAQPLGPGSDQSFTASKYGCQNLWDPCCVNGC